MKLFSLSKFPLENKTILLRADLNVPLEKGKVTDDTKIKASLETIKFLLEKNCKIILCTHLGRPEGKVVEELRTNPLAEELRRLLPEEKITKLDDCIGKEVKGKIMAGGNREVFVLENLRFYKEEQENDPVFAQSLAELTDVYINDGFAVCHREEASVVAVTEFLPAVAGFQLEKEIFNLSKALHPERPAVWLIGGAKLDKVDLIEKALERADHLLIGGALAFPFLKAQGVKVGMSKVEGESVEVARKILAQSSAKKIVLPVDFVAADDFSATAESQVVAYNQIGSQQMGLDIGPQTIKLFKSYLNKALTIVWNGPLGKYEWAKFATGTKEIGRYIGKLTATSLCGGGETADAINKFHLQHEITHVSTGGGAALMFLSGKKLPGLVALGKNYDKFSKMIKP